MASTHFADSALGSTDNSFSFKPESTSLNARAIPGMDMDTPSATVPASKAQFPGVTPSTPNQSYVGDTAKTEDGPTIADTLLWIEPFRTAIFFTFGAVALGMWYYVAHGDHTMTFTSGLAYVCLALLGFNLILNTVSSSWSSYSKWTGSNLIKASTSIASDGCNLLAVTYDKFLLASDPGMALKVILVLWVLVWLGAHLSTWTIAALLYVAAFTVPVAIHRNRKQIDLTLADASTTMRERVQVQLEKLKLTRLAFIGMGLLAYIACFFLVSWASVAVLTLLVIAYGRMLLKPGEVDAIRTAAEPYTASVRRMSQKVTRTMDDYMTKFNLSPAPKAHFR